MASTRSSLSGDKPDQPVSDASEPVSSGSSTLGIAPSRGRRPIRPPKRHLPEDAVQHCSKPKFRGNLPKSLRQCRIILREMKSQKYINIAYPFLYPVDEAKDNAPGYYKIIEKPMNLQEIERKLDAREYPNAVAFADDVRLMFVNCHRYNAVDSPISKLANELQGIFELSFDKVPLDEPDYLPMPPPLKISQSSDKHSNGTRKRPRAPAQESSSDTDTADSEPEEDGTGEFRRRTMRNVEKKIEEEAERLAFVAPIQQSLMDITSKAKKSKETLSNRPSNGGKDMKRMESRLKKKTKHSSTKSSKKAESAVTSSSDYLQTPADYPSDEEDHQPAPMSMDEKLALIKNIYKLPSKNLAEVLEIVKNSEESLRAEMEADPDSEEIQLDFDRMQPATIHRLDDYVKKLRVKKRGRKAPISRTAKPTKPAVNQSVKKADSANNGSSGSDGSSETDGE